MSPCHPTFSIVIPTYNRPDRLAHCLESLTHLTTPRDNFEVIVVDDGSSPPIAPTIDRFHSALNLTILCQTNQGPAQARNAGAAQAQGQYLAFTDDDCQPHPNWLNALAPPLRQQPRALVGGRTLNALGHNRFSTASQLLIDYLYDYYNRRQRPSFFASNNFAMATEWFHQVGGFDTAFPLAAGEDREFCDRWLQQGWPLVYAPDAQIDHSHDLSLRRFWRQHFNYGRGAYCFHQARAHRAAGPLKVEPLTFYVQLLTYPLTGSPQGLLQGMPLAGLMLLSQVANVAGFFWERHRHQGRQTSTVSG
jgi:GT2 family glycosyltransferase